MQRILERSKNPNGEYPTQKKRHPEKEREREMGCLGRFKKRGKKMSCGDPQLEREREREGP